MKPVESNGFVPNVPGSRSIAARALVCASLAAGKSQISNTPICDDTEAITNCIKYLSADAQVTGTDTSVTGWGKVNPSQAVLDCNASGTTMRFIAALALLTDEDLLLTGTPRLLARPMDGLVEVLEACGKKLVDQGNLRSISGPTNIPDELTVDANKSGQFVSGLLMALAACKKQVKLTALNPVSVPFIEMTIKVMQSFGAQVSMSVVDKNLEFNIAGTGYQPKQFAVEPDVMSANYFLALGAITGRKVFIPNITKQTIQGDVAMVRTLEAMGATIEYLAGGISASRDAEKPLVGCTVDLSQMPDMSLTIAAVAAVAKGPTTMTSSRILEYKESDRMAVIVNELSKVGAQVQVSSDKDTITIHPPVRLQSAAIDTYEDHRVAMAFGILTVLEPQITINNPECVSKTWPAFFAELDRFKALDK